MSSSSSDSENEAPQEVSFSKTLKQEKELRKVAPIHKTIRKSKASTKNKLKKLLKAEIDPKIL